MSVQYKVVFAYTIYPNQHYMSLDAVVAEHLKDGWEPVGGVSFGGPSDGKNQLVFMQAMIKREKK